MKAMCVLLLLIFILVLPFLVDGKVFAANDSFSANGQISSLVFGMPASTNTVNMSSVEKFILSGYWKLVTDSGSYISGLIDVKINGESAWSDVPTTISISKGRTISINLADNGTQRHFMGQPIYGIVNELTMMSIPPNDIVLNSNMTNKSSSVNTTIPERLPPESINGSNVPKIRLPIL